MCTMNNPLQLIFWSIVVVCLTVVFVMLIDRIFKYCIKKAELTSRETMEDKRLNKSN